GGEDLGRGDPRPRDRPGLSRSRRRQAMKAVLVVAALAIACGGGSKARRPDAASDQTPSWLSEGTGAVRNESGRMLQGVGVASGVNDPKARRRQADNAAREQIQAAVDALSRAIAKAGGSPQDGDAVRAIAR